jgi:hypothetical protein
MAFARGARTGVLPTPAQIGGTRVGGVDLNKPRTRAALSAVLALSAASGGFTVAEFTAEVHAMTGHTGYSIRQAAYDLRKLRGEELIAKPGRTHRYHLEPQTAGSIAALLTLREQVIAPILAGVRSPRTGRKPAAWPSIDRDYEKIRIDMQTLTRRRSSTPPPGAAHPPNDLRVTVAQGWISALSLASMGTWPGMSLDVGGSGTDSLPGNFSLQPAPGFRPPSTTGPPRWSAAYHAVLVAESELFDGLA